LDLTSGGKRKEGRKKGVSEEGNATTPGANRGESDQEEGTRSRGRVDAELTVKAGGRRSRKRGGKKKKKSQERPWTKKKKKKCQHGAGKLVGGGGAALLGEEVFGKVPCRKGKRSRSTTTGDLLGGGGLSDRKERVKPSGARKRTDGAKKFLEWGR